VLPEEGAEVELILDRGIRAHSTGAPASGPILKVPNLPDDSWTADELEELAKQTQQVSQNAYLINQVSNSQPTYVTPTRPSMHTTIGSLIAEQRLLVWMRKLDGSGSFVPMSHGQYQTMRNIHLDELNEFVKQTSDWYMGDRSIATRPKSAAFSIIIPELDTPPEKETPETMLEQLLRLYTMFMVTGATSPMPHFVGPPGSGKSTVFKTLADMLGVRLFTVNVSRISPLELEGVQMPSEDRTKLDLLHNPMWTQLKDGDIVLLDEFLRGFPEVYNGLLDILTAREVAGLRLPKVFIAGASNSVVTYDGALEDRLLHIKVPDPRKGTAERGRLAWMIIDQLGLDPRIKGSTEMDELFEKEILPMFEVLDAFDGKGHKVGSTNTSIEGTSVRKLIGQAELRHVLSPALKALIEANNHMASAPGKGQYMFLLSGDKVPAGYESTARALGSAVDKLTPVQRRNRELNLQLIEMQKQKASAKTREDDDDGPF
jgi:hypothetical protein